MTPHGPRSLQHFPVFTAVPAPVLRSAFTILLHTLVWGLVGMLLVLQQPDYPGPKPGEFWLKQAVVFALLTGVFYLNTAWAGPKLLYRRGIPAYLAVNLATVLLVLAVHQQVEQRLHVPELVASAREAALNPPNPWCAPRPRPQLGTELEGGGLFNPGILLTTLMVIGLATSITAVQRAQRDAEARLHLEQQKLETELSLLKAQINPHFFFNTLHNIYALTLIDGEQARAALHRLSRMMRYVLYETAAGTTLLSQEIGFLRDYTDLMHLRLTSKVRVVFEAPEPPRPDQPIAPMMLLPFVENAFKHGVSATAPSLISILIHQPTADTVELIVRNTLFEERPEVVHEAGGIGLTNTRRRLQLLYPDAHALVVTEQTIDNEYEVRLTLHLTS
jgi:two-component system, LytTR family, sensor kinase